MRESFHRRRFFKNAAATGLSASLAARAGTGRPGANDTVIVGIMGMGSRGRDHAGSFAKLPGVEVAAVCDVDSQRTAQAIELVEKAGGKAPKGVGDFRKMLDDKGLDAVIVASCNHWHAPATLLACSAGKHVYVEKPCSHTPREGELLVESARKHDRVVQMGNQRRSWPKVIEAIGRVRGGDIGKAYLARCWYNNDRPSIGKGKEGPPPEGLDFELWQGPVTRKPFRSNILHYNWHWFWHWGNGELGNNGIHMIDVCRWGLGVDFPNRVTSQGGRYRFDDDQETPDTHIASYEFDGGKLISWEGLSCSKFRPGGTANDVVFWGDKGSLAIQNGGYTLYDHDGKQVEKVTGQAGDGDHVTNFVEAVRGNAKPNSQIGEGHRSTLLCHLGNIAHRTGRSLKCDPQDGHILKDDQAAGYWTKEYAPGWEPKV